MDAPPDLVPDSLVDALEAIAREAAAMGVRHVGRVASERKADGTVVTDADRAMQAHIVTRLRRLEPDPRALYLLCEENLGGLAQVDPLVVDPNPGLSDPHQATLVAAVDPLDGTASYATGLPLWTVSIGLLAGGRPVAGVVYAPLLGGGDGWLYRAGPAGPATRNGAPLGVRPFAGWSKVRQVGVPSNFHQWASLEVFRGKLRSLGSTAHHLCLVAAGALDAAVVGTAHLWDLAAGAAILARSGGALMGRDGAEPAWDALLEDRVPRDILVAAEPRCAQALHEHVRIGPSEGPGATAAGSPPQPHLVFSEPSP